MDRRSFEAVTGPKTDYWLVRTVGALAGAGGVALAVGSRRCRPATDTLVLAAALAVAFGAVDAVYVARRRISKVYLADLAVESGFLALTIRTAQRHGLPG